jgi:hypothetical protein
MKMIWGGKKITSGGYHPADIIRRISSGGFHPADFIRNNPVKHGLVQRVEVWRWSSFHRYVRMGYYEPDWGGEVEQEVKELRCGECAASAAGRQRAVGTSSNPTLRAELRTGYDMVEKAESR